MTKGLTLTLCVVITALVLINYSVTRHAPGPIVAEASTATQPVRIAATQPGGGANAPVPSREDGYAGRPLTTEPVILRILRWQRNPAEESLFAKWLSEFNAAHPNISFQEEVVPFGRLADKIQAAVAGGDPPDIFFIDGPNTKTYAYLKILAPLDPYITKEFKNDIIPASLAENSYKNQLYSFPDRQAVLALAYNADMTKAAGIEPPTELRLAWTWDRALDAWKKLQQDPSGTGTPKVWGLEPSRFGAGGAGFYYRDGIFSRSAGDPKAPPNSSLYKTFAAISADGSTVTGYVDSPEAIKAMEWFQDLTMKWKITSKVGIPNAFLDKKAAMTIDHDGLIGRVRVTYPNGGFNLAYTPIPYFKTEMSMSGSNASGISAKSKHQAEAAAFLVYIYSGKNALRYWNVNRGLPARHSLYAQIPDYNKLPYSLFKDVLAKIAVPRPSRPGWTAFDSIINAAIKDISLGAPVADRLHRAARDIDAQLAKYPSQ